MWYKNNKIFVLYYLRNLIYKFNMLRIEILYRKKLDLIIIGKILWNLENNKFEKKSF